MKKASKLALAALALSLVPFELKPGKDGSFSYKSLLVGISTKKMRPGSGIWSSACSICRTV